MASTGEQRIGKDFDGSGRGLVGDIVSAFDWMD
jgi:hypothetical protein